MDAYMTQLSPGPVDRLKLWWLTDEYCRIDKELARCCQTARTGVQKQEDRTAELRDPAYPEGTIRRSFQNEIAQVKGVMASKEFAGAVAELAVIEELEQLPNDCVVINDLRIEAVTVPMPVWFNPRRAPRACGVACVSSSMRLLNDAASR